MLLSPGKNAGFSPWGNSPQRGCLKISRSRVPRKSSLTVTATLTATLCILTFSVRGRIIPCSRLPRELPPLTGSRAGHFSLPDPHQNDARQEASMKRAYFISLFPCLTLLCLTTSLFSQSNPVSLINRTAAVASPRVASPITASQAGPQAQARILEGYGKLPLSFEANHGQADARVKFLSRTGGYTLFLTGDEAVLAWSGKKTKKTSPQRLKPAFLAVLAARQNRPRQNRPRQNRP